MKKILILLILLSSCVTYKGNYSEAAYKYNKKYSKQHKTNNPR